MNKKTEQYLKGYLNKDAETYNLPPIKRPGLGAIIGNLVGNMAGATNENQLKTYLGSLKQSETKPSITPMSKKYKPIGNKFVNIMNTITKIRGNS